MNKPNPIITKMALLLMLIEMRIHKEACVFLPKQRSRFIDLTTLELSVHEDDFFTYDQIKQLVINMVQRHESGAHKWHIDTKNSTDKQIALVVDGQQTLVPISILMTMTINTVTPLH